MAKDYKHRIQGKNTLKAQDFDPVQSLSVWKWMVITGTAIAVVVSGVYFSGIGQKDPIKEVTQTQTNTTHPPKEPEQKPQPQEPEVKATQFDFYTILADKEKIVPDYEIKTRTHEDKAGQAKATHYIIQAGSYAKSAQAEQMRAKLAAMGIEAKVQKATVGTAAWYRVKLGPFEQIASVNAINARLKQNAIDTIVTETDK
jgi:cell division protein FtsN